MRNTSDTITLLASLGITVSLVSGLLKVEPKSLITDEVRAEIKTHRAELVSILSQAVAHPPIVREGLHPCSICGGTLFNEGSMGGYFCVNCQKLPEGAHVSGIVRGTTPRKPMKVHWEPTTVLLCNIPKRLPSPVALKWLRENRQTLDAAGWTRAELYRRNKSNIGLAWLALWDQAFFLAHLHDDGTIEFECSMNGRDYIQSARPINTRR